MAITQESFDALLKWLDPDDREAAGRAYENIRAGLVSILISRGFSHAEDLADETINRVTNRVQEIAPTYQGLPVRYFYGVLRNVMKEQRPKKEITTDNFPAQFVQAEEVDTAYECLVQCLKLLASAKRELILNYYTYESGEKVKSHARMANELGISENALRIRAYYIRNKLEKCVHECLSALK